MRLSVDESFDKDFHLNEMPSYRQIPFSQKSVWGALDDTPNVFQVVECLNFSNSLDFLTKVTFLGRFRHFLGRCQNLNLSQKEGNYSGRYWKVRFLS